MSAQIAWNRYGKSRIRLVKLRRPPGERQDGPHEIVDLSLDIQLEGAFDAVYVDGDNSGCLPTDTMKNTVYAFARRDPIDHVETFGLRLAEHFDLTQGRRPEVIDRIKKARELGDLKENADYTSAREEQSFLEGKIQAIEAQLRHAVVVQPTDGNRVALGSRVTIEAAGEELEFTIVGPAESDPGSGRISSASPVGRALVGRAAGDHADVATPRGVVRYRVVSIG